MTVTMLEVALKAGVDKATVSRVLKGDPRISEKTKLKVMEAVHALGYRLDRNARNLSTSRSGLVGVVLRELSESWFSAFAAGLDRTFANSDYELMFKCTNGDPRRAARELGRLSDRRIEGLVWQDAGTAPNGFTVHAVTLGFSTAESYSILSDAGELVPTFETGVLAGRVILNLISGKTVPSRCITVRTGQ